MLPLILILFCISLLGCILFDISILVALVIGFVLFFSYGLLQHHSFSEMLHFAINGMKTVKNILITFLLIGVLTGVWRACGTIPYIICSTADLIRPSLFLLLSFLLCCLISFLTGTSFGTAATMGVICMTMGRTMQINPILAGGTILSGILFGDRCSPVSTSALLVSELTGTDIYDNIRNMFRICVVPFLLTCGIYLFFGITGSHGGESLDILSVFSDAYRLHWLTLLPAVAILLLSLIHVRVKTSMTVSILLAVIVSIFVQRTPLSEVAAIALRGYRASTPELAAMMNGGGLISMVRVCCIVCLSSSYAGMFEGTHMLDQIKDKIADSKKRIPPFGGILAVSVVVAAISCNQTLSIILTNQLCDTLEPEKNTRALALEDAPVIICPLIPWSIAGAVPIAAIGAPGLCIIAACYLYLLPLWHLIKDWCTYHSSSKAA